MARRVSRLSLLRQIDALAPAIRAAFVQAILQLRSEAAISVVSTLLEEGRLDEVLDVLGIDPARFVGVTERVRDAYAAGGAQGAGEIPRMRGPGGSMLGARFDIRNPVAEAWLRNHSSSLVTSIVRDQLEAIRITVSSGVGMGRGPRQMALDLVGRVSATGRRAGGIVGLTSQQAGYVATARAQLLSGVPEEMAGYFNRVARDRRFDGIVRRAIEAGRPVSAADVDRIAGRYADRLLRLRGEMIARTEALTAFNTGRDEAIRQHVAAGRISGRNVQKEWSASGDDRVRDTHAAMNGQTVPFDQPFTSPSGAQLMHPGDTSLGAGAAEIIQCRCSVRYRIDQIAEAMENG